MALKHVTFGPLPWARLVEESTTPLGPPSTGTRHAGALSRRRSTILVDKDVFFIGRNPQCDLVIASQETVR
jgi:hypothetical protein